MKAPKNKKSPVILAWRLTGRGNERFTSHFLPLIIHAAIDFVNTTQEGGQYDHRSN